SAIAVRHAKFCSHPYVARLLGKTGFSSSLEVDNSCLQNGMVRVSFGIYTNEKEVDKLIETVRDIAAGKFDELAAVDRYIKLAQQGIKLPNDRG
ncbi:MAG: hypothetical protein LBU88_04390, partial [Treponema sp.]|nr:hypothetical protein [Treponema sp.]